MPDAFPPDDTWWIYLVLLFLGIAVIVNDPAKKFWRNFFVLWLNRRSAAGKGGAASDRTP
jgi:hypothetical protein